jgi:hypothetical protein
MELRNQEIQISKLVTRSAYIQTPQAIAFMEDCKIELKNMLLYKGELFRNFPSPS